MILKLSYVYCRYWKDYFHRWKRNGFRTVNVNTSQKLSIETETPGHEDSVGTIGSKGLDIKSQGRTKEHMWDNVWTDFRKRWTVDSHLKGETDASCQSKTGKCTYPSERKELSVLPEDRSIMSYSASVIEKFLDRTAKKSVRDPITTEKNFEYKKTEKSQSLDGESKGRDSPSEELCKDFHKISVPFENPLFPNGIFPLGHGTPEYYSNIDLERNANTLSPTVTTQQRDLQVISCVESASDGNWIHDDESYAKEAPSIPTKEDTKLPSKLERNVAGFHLVKSYEASVMKKSEEASNVKRKRHSRSGYLKKRGKGNLTSVQSDGHFLSKEKQQLKNLTQLRGQEIRKQRILRRELKKKEKKAKLRAEEADRLVSEMRRERCRLEKEKKNLRRSWKALKREKKRISSEKERHRRNRTEMNNFFVALKREKQKLKRKKVELREKVKELLTKERKKLKLKEKTLSAEKKKEVERLRNKIVQEKNKLRQQKEELKSLKKAAKEEYKKWLNELRNIKRQEKEKQNEKARKKREKADRQHKKEYDSVVKEQAKFDKEKRRKKKDNTRRTVESKKLKDKDELRNESVDDKTNGQDLRKTVENDGRVPKEVEIEAKEEENKRSKELPRKRKNLESKEKIWKVKEEGRKRTGKRANEKLRIKVEKDEKKRKRKKEYDSVIAEQVEYDKEKRRAKGEGAKSKFSKGEWKMRSDNVKKEASRPKNTKEKRKRSNGEGSFKKQLEGIQKWLSDVHNSAIEHQQGQGHWPWTDGEVSFRKKLEDVGKWLSDVPKKALEQPGKTINWPWSLIKPYFDAGSNEGKTSGTHHDAGDSKEKELNMRDLNSAKAKRAKDREKSTERCDWENGRVQAKEIFSKTEKKGNKKERKMPEEVKKSEIAVVPEHKALAGFTNLTFDMDLMLRMLLKGDVKPKRAEKTSDDSDKTTETAFVIVSEESTYDVGKKKSRQGPKSSVKKPKRTDEKPKRPRDNKWWKDRNRNTVKRDVKLPQGPISGEDGQVRSDFSYEEANHRKVSLHTSLSEGPIPPKDIGLSVEEWLEKRFNLPKNSQEKLSPQGPILSDEVYRTQSSKGKKRKNRRNTDMQEDKVSNSVDSETVESVPPPNWLFERAKGRTHQRSEPWYERRAEDRDFQRSTDKYESWFPCDTKRKPYKGPLDPSWFFDRAHDRAFQRLNNVPWYTRRAEGRETERQKGEDSWFIERGYYRKDSRDISSCYGDQNWMPQGPSMEEHR